MFLEGKKFITLARVVIKFLKASSFWPSIVLQMATSCRKL